MVKRIVVRSPKQYIPLGIPYLNPGGQPRILIKCDRKQEDMDAIEYIELLFGKGIWEKGPRPAQDTRE